MIGFKSLARKTTNLLLALALVSAQLFAPLSAVVPKATAAIPDVCVSDVQGANDEPGQKDLTRFCQADDDVAGEITISWQWDEIAWSGNNTGDACALFDTNSNNFSNYAVCVTVSGNPATQSGVSPRIYTCNDSALEKCAGSSLVASPYQTTCSVNQSATDPFAGPPNKKKGAAYPNDTRALCVIKLSEVGAGAAVLKDVCSFPSQQPNSDPSDCVITPTGQPNPVIELRKDIAPNSDLGRFNLRIDLATDAIANNVGDGGTTGEVEFSTSSVVIEESAFTGTSLSDYTTQVVCIDDENPATPFFNESRVGTLSRTATINPPQGVVDITCTFINTRQQGTITLIKNVVNNNGGSASVNDFGLSIGGTAVTSGQTLTLSPNSYAINEVGLTGYAFVNITGTGCPAQLGGNVVLANGQNITCTITNDDVAPSLTLVKQVTNNDGGGRSATEWTLSATGSSQSPTNLSGAGGAVSGSNFKADTYTLDETGPADYTEGTWNCTNSVTVNGNNQITLANGQTTICTITNNDIAPTLKLVKLVVNNNGGGQTANAWTLRAQRPDLSYLINTQGSHTNQEGTAAQTNTTSAVAGVTYTLSENGPSGYAASDWSCDVDNVLNGSQLTMPLDTDVTCTIVNDDMSATLILIKLLPNDDGGTATQNDFDVFINGQLAQWGSNTVDAGDHTVSEQSLAGYLPSGWSVNCDADGNVSLANGEAKTCQITNDDIAPTLTLRKVVINDDGGDNDADEWTLTAQAGANPALINEAGLANQDGSEAFTQTTTAKAGMGYTLSESGGPDGYTPGSWSCDGGSLVGSTVTLALDEDVICTITNNDQAAELILVKNIISDDGGTATQAAFTPLVDSLVSTWGTQIVDAGTYTVSEQDPTSIGYAFEGVICYVTGNQQNGVNHPVTLDSGESRTCVVTNDDIAPTLTLVKEVINDNSGQADPSDFTLTADPTVGDTISGPSTVNSDARANTLYSLSESGPDGYHVEIDWLCDGGTFDAQADTVTLALNQDVKCTIVNDDDAHPAILLTKTGPAVAHEGDNVQYTFTVENTGDEPLENVVITDPLIDNITYVSGDTNTDSILDVDETWLFTASYLIPVNQIADVYNLAEVCADPREGEEVCDEDDHTIDVLHPSITVVKSGPALAYEGQEVGYTFVVTNTGDTTLYNVSISDDIASNETCEESTLAPGESTDCTAIYIVPIPTEDNVINNVDACGFDVLQFEVCDDDSHELDVIHPSIQIIKTGPTTAHEGDMVTYTFTVTNTGDVPLSSVTVNDNIAGAATYVSGDTNTDDNLDLTETWTFTVDFVIPGEQDENVDNTATACGLDPIQAKERQATPVCDEDDHSLDVLHPSLNVVKDGPAEANPGDMVTYTFTVTNTGDTPLDITTVNDNVAGDGVYQSGDTNTNDLLDLTETWIYEVGYEIPAEQNENIDNTVTVCADDSLEEEVCDEDDHHLIVLAKVTVTKYNDFNRNGQRDENEPTLPDWKFTLQTGEDEFDICDIIPTFPGCEGDICNFLPQLCGELDTLFLPCGSFPFPPCDYGYSYSETQSTGQDGTTTFNNVRPGVDHYLSETVKNGWTWSNTICEYENEASYGRVIEDNNYKVEASPGEDVRCEVGNYRAAYMLIEKTNDRPEPVNTGEVVTYTITVTVPEDSNPVYGATVTDLPPEGFEYIPGSETATQGSLTTPYASPGVWSLGDLFPGDVVTLTYQTRIANSASPGTYPDLAFASGCDDPRLPVEEDNCVVNVYANVTNIDEEGTPFVGTEVTIRSPQVLAANTTVLVNTGSADIWKNMMIGTLLMGAALATLYRRDKKGGRA